MKIEVVSLGQQVTLQANPPITQFKFGNRSAETTLNVKDGETIVLGGLIQEQDQRIKTTIPWIGDLPLIGNLLSGFQTVKVTTEVILTITPHIVQSMTPPSLATQAFWSGTEMNYATNPLFSGSAKKTSLSSTGGLGNTSSAAPAGSARKESERIDERRALAQVAVPDPALLVRPDEASITVGKEVKLAIVDGRLRASEDNVFRLEYDPKVLQFKRLVDADLVRQVDPVSGENARSDGTLAFRLTRPSQTAPRSVTVTFLAKAPGVSPVRVEVDGVSGESTGSASEVGTGVVRVR
jgi:general secretion pathway protein D